MFLSLWLAIHQQNAPTSSSSADVSFSFIYHWAIISIGRVTDRQNKEVKSESWDQKRLVPKCVPHWGKAASCTQLCRVLQCLTRKPSFPVTAKGMFPKHCCELGERRQKQSAKEIVGGDETHGRGQEFCQICDNSGVSKPRVLKDQPARTKTRVSKLYRSRHKNVTFSWQFLWYLLKMVAFKIRPSGRTHQWQRLRHRWS